MLDAMAEPKQKEMCVKLCELLLATAVSGKLKKSALRVCTIVNHENPGLRYGTMVQYHDNSITRAIISHITLH